MDFSGYVEKCYTKIYVDRYCISMYVNFRSLKTKNDKKICNNENRPSQSKKKLKVIAMALWMPAQRIASVKQVQTLAGVAFVHSAQMYFEKACVDFSICDIVSLGVEL